MYAHRAPARNTGTLELLTYFYYQSIIYYYTLITPMDYATAAAFRPPSRPDAASETSYVESIGLRQRAGRLLPPPPQSRRQPTHTHTHTHTTHAHPHAHPHP